MQAGAREFAGMPPLSRPTAATVNANQPTIPSPRYAQQQQGVTYIKSSSVVNPANRRDSHSGSSATVVSTKPTPAPSSKEGMLAAPHMAPLVGPRVKDLVKSLDPSYTIEPSAEKQVLELLDDFLDKV